MFGELLACLAIYAATIYPFLVHTARYYHLIRTYRIDFGDNFGASYVFPALWVALWNSFLQTGADIGSASAGAYQDRYGRGATVFRGGLLGCIGAAVSYVSGMPATMTERRISFMFVKAILGASCGFLMSACQTYISETSPRDLRGLFLGFYAFIVVCLI